MSENEKNEPREGFIQKTARKSQFLNKVAFIVILLFVIVAVVGR